MENTKDDMIAISEEMISLRRRMGASLDEKRALRLVRFLWYVEKLTTTDCWVWTGGLNPAGYGQFHNGKTTVLAHRYSYESHVGDIPRGKVLDHLCTNKTCVNPRHLEPVTPAENSERARIQKMLVDKTY